MSSHPDISTPRLLLRNITPDLIHELFRTEKEAAITAFFGTDENGYFRLKQMHENGMETYRISLSYFLLLDGETRHVIGECGYHSWNKTHHRAELFYNLKDDAYKRKGLMSEALTTVLAFGFNTMRLHRIEAKTAHWNTASIKLLEHFKFKKEGTLREDYLIDGKHENSECYSLLRPEWQKQPE